MKPKYIVKLDYFKMWPKYLFILISIHLISADEAEIKVTYMPSNCNRLSKANDVLVMHYRGTLPQHNDKEFDSSYSRDQPFKFQLGLGQVIKGWEKGAMAMCIGEKRELIIPPELGYGDKGYPPVIPAKATLKFEIELIDIEEGESPTNVFKQMDTNNDGMLSREEVSEFLRHQVPGGDADSTKLKDFEHNNLIEEIFSHEDHNKDGLISKSEFSGPKHALDEL